MALTWANVWGFIRSELSTVMNHEVGACLRFGIVCSDNYRRAFPGGFDGKKYVEGSSRRYIRFGRRDVTFLDIFPENIKRHVNVSVFNEKELIMANVGTRVKRKDVNMADLEKKMLEFARENFSEKMVFDVTTVKRNFGLPRNIIVETYAFGSEELKKFKLDEGKSAVASKKVEPPVLTGRGTITVKKCFIDEYNEKNPANQIKEGDSFDVDVEGGKIVLIRK